MFCFFGFRKWYLRRLTREIKRLQKADVALEEKLELLREKKRLLTSTADKRKAIEDLQKEIDALLKKP